MAKITIDIDVAAYEYLMKEVKKLKILRANGINEDNVDLKYFIEICAGIGQNFFAESLEAKPAE